MQNEDYGKTDGNAWFGEASRGERDGPAMRQALELWRPAEGEESAGGSPPAAETRLPPPPMGFAERFLSLETTPRAIALGVQEENGRFAAVCFEGRAYKPTDRFLKGLARRMKVPVAVFTLFSPVEVVHRAAAVAPDLGLRVTLDEEKGEALGLIENTGHPIPADAVERVMKEDGRLQRFGYANGVIEGMFDIGESWSIPGDSDYRVQVRASVPVDGMDAPDEDDNGMFTLQKTFVDGSGIEWPIALLMETILRLCEAEGIDLGDAREHVFRKAPIRVVAWSYELSESFCYAYCDFPGPDATETDLEAVKVPENEGRDADEDGFGEEEP